MKLTGLFFCFVFPSFFTFIELESSQLMQVNILVIYVSAFWI